MTSDNADMPVEDDLEVTQIPLQNLFPTPDPRHNPMLGGEGCCGPGGCFEELPKPPLPEAKPAPKPFDALLRETLERKARDVVLPFASHGQSVEALLALIAIHSINIESLLRRWDLGREVELPPAPPVPEPKTKYLVKLTYFKTGGKYYSDGEYWTEKPQLFDIVAEVRAMQQAKKLPGLAEGAWDFSILVNVPDHPHDHPSLIHPRKFEG